MSVKKNPLISVITTCYNGEAFLRKYFDVLLGQTYKHIELIFVNDGSTDKTKNIIKGYLSKLEREGIKAQIIHFTQNMGTSFAINEGLKHFSGKYLMFLDSDDIMYPNHIMEKIKFLENNKEYAWAVCLINKTDKTKKLLGKLQIKHSAKTENLFERFILCKDVYFTPIGFVYRSSCFLEANPTRSLFISRVGPNWQILLPMAYKYNCAFIDKLLGDYIVRKNSSSHLERRINKKERYLGRKTVLLETIKRIKPANKQYYVKLIERRYDPK